MSMPQPQDLSDEMLDMIHRAAGPIPPPDRRQFYNLVGTWLDSCVLVTPVNLREALRSAQSELLRAPARA
jgi:hypothetical protein